MVLQEKSQQWKDARKEGGICKECFQWIMEEEYYGKKSPRWVLSWLLQTISIFLKARILFYYFLAQWGVFQDFKVIVIAWISVLFWQSRSGVRAVEMEFFGGKQFSSCENLNVACFQGFSNWAICLGFHFWNCLVMLLFNFRVILTCFYIR